MRLSLSVNFNLVVSVPASVSPFLTWAAASPPYLGRDFAPATNQVCWELHLGPSTAPLPGRTWTPWRWDSGPRGLPAVTQDRRRMDRRTGRGGAGAWGEPAVGYLCPVGGGEVGRSFLPRVRRPPTKRCARSPGAEAPTSATRTFRESHRRALTERPCGGRGCAEGGAASAPTGWRGVRGMRGAPGMRAVPGCAECMGCAGSLRRLARVRPGTAPSQTGSAGGAAGGRAERAAGAVSE